MNSMKLSQIIQSSERLVSFNSTCFSFITYIRFSKKTWQVTTFHPTHCQLRRCCIDFQLGSNLEHSSSSWPLGHPTKRLMLISEGQMIDGYFVVFSLLLPNAMNNCIHFFQQLHIYTGVGKNHPFPWFTPHLHFTAQPPKPQPPSTSQTNQAPSGISFTPPFSQPWRSRNVGHGHKSWYETFAPWCFFDAEQFWNGRDDGSS